MNIIIHEVCRSGAAGQGMRAAALELLGGLLQAAGLTVHTAKMRGPGGLSTVC